MAVETIKAPVENVSPSAQTAGTPAASVASAPPATTQTAPSTPESPSDSFIVSPSGDKGKPEGAAETTAAALTRPEWLPENLWDAEKGAKVEDIKSLWDDGNKARERAAAVPKTPAEYKPDLPKIEGLPEGVTIDTANPLFAQAAAFAHENGLSQAEFSRLLGVEAQRVMAQQAALTAAIKARDEALGPNRAARMDALTAWVKTTTPDEGAASKVMKMIGVTKESIEWAEGLQRALGSQGVAPLSRGGPTGNQPGKIEGYEKMTMAQKLIAGGHA